MKQKQKNRRPVRPNRITRRTSWLLAPIPSNVRAMIDREAQKRNIGLGQAVANLILRKAVVA